MLIEEVYVFIRFGGLLGHIAILTVKEKMKRRKKIFLKFGRMEPILRVVAWK